MPTCVTTAPRAVLLVLATTSRLTRSAILYGYPVIILHAFVERDAIAKSTLEASFESHFNDRFLLIEAIRIATVRI